MKLEKFPSMPEKWPYDVIIKQTKFFEVNFFFILNKLINGQKLLNFRFLFSTKIKPKIALNGCDDVIIE